MLMLDQPTFWILGIFTILIYRYIHCLGINYKKSVNTLMANNVLCIYFYKVWHNRMHKPRLGVFFLSPLGMCLREIVKKLRRFCQIGKNVLHLVKFIRKNWTFGTKNNYLVLFWPVQTCFMCFSVKKFLKIGEKCSALGKEFESVF